MTAFMNAAMPALSMHQPTEVDGYLIVARQLLQGVEALSTLPNVPPRSCALLAAQASECALKAFRLHKDENRDDKKGKKLRNETVKHDLIAQWKLACTEGLSIPREPPQWIKDLGFGHGPAYYFRYQEGNQKTVVHGGQIPALIPMARALKELIAEVESAIQC